LIGFIRRSAVTQPRVPDIGNDFPTVKSKPDTSRSTRLRPLDEAEAASAHTGGIGSSHPGTARPRGQSPPRSLHHRSYRRATHSPNQALSAKPHRYRRPLTFAPRTNMAARTKSIVDSFSLAGLTPIGSLGLAFQEPLPSLCDDRGRTVILTPVPFGLCLSTCAGELQHRRITGKRGLAPPFHNPTIPMTAPAHVPVGAPDSTTKCVQDRMFSHSILSRTAVSFSQNPAEDSATSI
jgi:hypothetical protein